MEYAPLADSVRSRLVPAVLRFLPENGPPRSLKAWVAARGTHEAIVLAEESVSEGELVWLEDEEIAHLHVVRNAAPAEGCIRLELRAVHPERRRSTRREEYRDADIEWRDGFKNTHLSVRLQNVSAGGAQFVSTRRLEEGTQVTLAFDDREHTGEVRWCSLSGDGFTVGLRFHRAKQSAEAEAGEARRPETGEKRLLSIPGLKS